MLSGRPERLSAALVVVSGRSLHQGTPVTGEFEKIHFRSNGPAMMSARIPDLTCGSRAMILPAPLLQQTPQHPRRLLMQLDPLCQQVSRRFVAGRFDNRKQ